MSDRALIICGVLWIALLALAVALSLFASANDTLPGDRAITDWLQDQPIPGQGFSDLIRALTGTEVVLATGVTLSLVLWLRGYRRQAILLGAGLVLLALLQPALKEIVDRPRPSADLVEIRAGGSSPSFPSGHVMSGALLYGFLLYLSLTLLLPRIPALILAAFAAGIIAVSGPVNVWLGVHWPSDVAGGWLWAAVILVPLFVADWHYSSINH